MKHITTVTRYLAAALMLMVWSLAAGAAEPVRPRADLPLSPEKEARIAEVAGLSADEVFVKLKKNDYRNDEALLNRAIYRSFADRKSSAIDYATNFLKGPVIEIRDGQVISRGEDFFIAKRIFEIFPNESARRLAALYRVSDAITRGNIINASGNLADNGKTIRNLLVKALDDKNVCEEENPETAGDLLRICDVAYNQLVLRYSIKNVLRTIGTSHSIETRDQHIATLKEMLH